jgi:hypothetical protein
MSKDGIEQWIYRDMAISGEDILIGDISVLQEYGIDIGSKNELLLKLSQTLSENAEAKKVSVKIIERENEK